jgi:hypothetical protein
MSGGEYTGLHIPQVVERGDRFGSRTVICETTKGRSGRRFSVRCDCGNVQTLELRRLNQIAKGDVGQRCRKCSKRKP